MGRDQHPTGSGRLSILHPSQQKIPHATCFKNELDVPAPAVPLAPWQRELLRTVGGMDDEGIRWVEEHLFGVIPTTSMEVKAFGPSMLSDVPVSVRPEGGNEIMMIYGKRGAKQFASILVVGLARMWGWPWEIVGPDRDKRGFHEEWRL